MQEPEQKERNARITYLLGRIVFVIFMVLALPGMHEAWKVTSGWQRLYELLAPWAFLGTAGVGIWTNTTRKKIERDTAAVLLMMIGFAANYAYEEIGRLASSHF